MSSNRQNANPAAISYRQLDSECDLHPGCGYKCLTTCPFPSCGHDTEVENRHHHKRKLFHRRKRKMSSSISSVIRFYRSVVVDNNTVGRSLCRAGVITPRSSMPLVYRLSGNVFAPLDGGIGVFISINSLPDKIIRLFVYCMGRYSGVKSCGGLTHILTTGLTQRQTQHHGGLDMYTVQVAVGTDDIRKEN